MPNRNTKEKKVAVCTPKFLPDELNVIAAANAVRENPANMPNIASQLTALDVPGADVVLGPQSIAYLTTKYWRSTGVRLTVSFMEAVQAPVRDMILEYANHWGKFANIKFSWTQREGQIRVSLGRGGYWSYLGTDCLSIPANQQTMNLEGISLRTSEKERRRVIYHEFGHALGCPHEHMRAAVIARLDPAKVIAWGRNQLGWSESQVRAQILTPLSEQSIRGTPEADDDSIMCYQFPGSVTKDGRPIPGGDDFTEMDKLFTRGIWPLEVVPPPPPPEDGGDKVIVRLEVDYKSRSVKILAN